MKVTGPELMLIAATRGMLGAGIGLLAAGKLSDDRRRLVGSILLGIGAASTIPLALRVFGGRRDTRINQSATSTAGTGTLGRSRVNTHPLPGMLRANTRP